MEWKQKQKSHIFQWLDIAIARDLSFAVYYIHMLLIHFVPIYDSFRDIRVVKDPMFGDWWRGEENQQFFFSMNHSPKTVRFRVIIIFFAYYRHLDRCRKAVWQIRQSFGFDHLSQIYFLDNNFQLTSDFGSNLHRIKILIEQLDLLFSFQ